jgi:arylsulfatase A-like enzyme
VLGIGHGHNLHHAVTHVPLIVVGPGVQPGLRIQQRVGLTDIFPTVSALTGLDVPSEVQGRSLTALLQGREGVARPYLSESIAYGHEKKAFYTQDGWLLLIPSSEAESGQLFNLREDPLESHNLWGERPEKVSELRAAYKRFARGLNEHEGRVQEIDAQERKALQELGYIDEDS